MNINISNIPVETFKKAVQEGSSYVGIARKLGNFSSRGGIQVKKRIDLLGLSFETEHPRRLPDHKYYVKGIDRHSGLRDRVLKDNFMPYTCCLCGIEPIWNGMSLTLELDHVDGDSSNNIKSNLRWLCPNCHTQTDTYGSKNGKSSRSYIRIRTCLHCKTKFETNNRTKKYCSSDCRTKATRKQLPVTKEELHNLLTKGSFTSVGSKFGVSDNSIRQWCVRYGMSTHAKDYK